MGRFDKTAQLLTEIDPKNAFIQYFIGGFKMGAGQSSEAKKHLNKAIELGEYRAYFSLALGGIAENSVEESLRLLTEYLKYYPNDEMANKLAKGLKEGTLEIKQDTGKPANP